MEEPELKYKAMQGSGLVALIFLVLGWAVAYWVWPAGIMDQTLAATTMGTLLQAIASGVIALVAVILALAVVE